jgi:hypothetical protein
LSGSTNKKVVVHRFDRPPLPGYLDTSPTFSNGFLELLSPAGEVQRVPAGEIKVLAYVRDFQPGGLDREQRRFRNRPKAEGLWVQLHFLDNDIFEGIAANNLAGLDGETISVLPPDSSSNNMRLVVPPSALRQCRVLGVIGGSAARKGKPEVAGQPGLFDS